MFDWCTMQMQGSTPTELLSSWFPRGGDYGLFTLEVSSIDGTGMPTLTVTVSQKASDSTELKQLSISRMTSGRSTVNFANGAGNATFGGFEDLVRYKFTLSGGISGTSRVTFRMLALM